MDIVISQHLNKLDFLLLRNVISAVKKGMFHFMGNKIIFTRGNTLTAIYYDNVVYEFSNELLGIGDRLIRENYSLYLTEPGALKLYNNDYTIYITPNFSYYFSNKYLGFTLIIDNMYFMELTFSFINNTKYSIHNLKGLYDEIYYNDTEAIGIKKLYNKDKISSIPGNIDISNKFSLGNEIYPFRIELSYFDNGKIERIRMFRYNKLNGLVLSCNSKGEIIHLETYTKGILNGYYYSDNETGFYRNGLKVGSWLEKGRPKSYSHNLTDNILIPSLFK